MNMPYKAYQNILSERTAIIALITTLAFFWSIDELSWLAFCFTAGIASILLIQLELKRRSKETFRQHRSNFEKKKSRNKDVKSLQANALNSLPTPILLIDANHIISMANDAARNLLGNDISGNDVFLYLRQSNFVSALDEVLAGTSSDKGVIRYTNTQGRSFDVTVAPVGSPNSENEAPRKNQLQAMVFFYEVTSLLQTEQMRVDFVANASHELRTPLTTITGFIETLQGPAKEDRASHPRFLDIMSKEANRMIRLIDDLLSLSKIEMSRHVMPEDILDIASLITSAVSAATPKAEGRGITFNVAFDSGSLKVKADSDQITQVFTNLIGNAAKYADQGTTVHVSAGIPPESDSLHISIRDEGPGIAPEHLGRLTERFYRVDTARSRKMGGTGLGLAIVKHILLRHSTQLDIQSAVGEGTSFSFKLPIAAE